MRKILLLLLTCAVTSVSFAQVPQKFAYQAVVRNANGQVIVNQDVSLRISLLVGSVSGHAVYSELHEITTSPLGIVNLQVGGGTLQSGDFGSIPWDDGIFIKIEIDPAGGNAFVLMGISQIVSMPYALKAGGLTKGAIEVKPAAGHDPEAPIFVVRNSNDQIVYAVYEDGVRFNVGDNSKSTRGGFAVGGLVDQTKGGKEINYLTILPDSVRFNIVSSGKNNRGGFAVGGLVDQTKEGASMVDYLFLRPDSIRFAIDEGSAGKSSRGGFAIGGLVDQTKAFNNYFMVSRDCTFVMNTLSAAGNVVVGGDMFTGGTIGTLPVSDADGNVYKTIRIGNQVWMAENLRTTKYSDGTPILSSEFNDMPPLFSPEYDGVPFPPKPWGYLYALQVINYTDKNICPNGWRLPTLMDWQELIGTIGGPYNAIALIDTSQNEWWSLKGGKQNKSSKNNTGFNALPAGYFDAEVGNTGEPFFYSAHYEANFWSQPFDMAGQWVTNVMRISDSYGFNVSNDEYNFNDVTSYYRGYSVRCIRIDNTQEIP